MSDHAMLPCPFCGQSDFMFPGVMLAWVRCANCGADGPVSLALEKSEAIERWNHRAARIARR